MKLKRRESTQVGARICSQELRSDCFVEVEDCGVERFTQSEKNVSSNESWKNVAPQLQQHAPCTPNTPAPNIEHNHDTRLRARFFAPLEPCDCITASTFNSFFCECTFLNADCCIRTIVPGRTCELKIELEISAPKCEPLTHCTRKCKWYSLCRCIHWTSSWYKQRVT